MKKFLISEEEKNRILGMHQDATKRHYLGEQGTQTQGGAVIGPEVTTKIQKIDNILGIAKTTPQIWASNFENVFEKVPNANWYGRSGQPATNSQYYPDFGYVKKGNNLENYKKVLALSTANKFLSNGKVVPNSPEPQYVISSYVSGPEGYTPSAISDSNYTENGLQKPEIVGVTQFAENAFAKMKTGLEAISKLYGGMDTMAFVEKQLPNTEFDYGKLPELMDSMNKTLVICEKVASLTKSKLQNPNTKMPNADYERAVNHLLSQLG